MEIFERTKIQLTEQEHSTRRRMVVKLGSSTVCEKNGVVRIPLLTSLAQQSRELHETKGVDVIFISSGASAVGRLSAPGITDRSLLSNIGQGFLTMAWNKAFYPTPVAHILLADEQLLDSSYIKNQVETALRHDVVPVINCVNPNTNNDITGRLVAHASDAELLAFLTTTDGVIKDDSTISSVHNIDDLLEVITEDTSDLGSGGMKPKCKEAWQFVHHSQGVAVIAHGMEDNILFKIAERQQVGTWFATA